MSRYYVRIVDICALSCLDGEPSTYERELYRVADLLEARGLTLSSAYGAAGGMLFFLQCEGARG